MPLGEDLLGKSLSTTAQLTAWLELSTEIDYAYLTLEEKQPSVAYELNVSGSSYEAFETGFFAVLKGASKVLDLGQVTADTTNPRRKPVVRKNNDSGGLRYVQPSDLGVEQLSRVPLEC